MGVDTKSDDDAVSAGELRQLAAALEAARDLVATVSHELRRPVAAIYGAALTLRRDDVELRPELHDKLRLK